MGSQLIQESPKKVFILCGMSISGFGTDRLVVLVHIGLICVYENVVCCPTYLYLYEVTYTCASIDMFRI